MPNVGDRIDDATLIPTEGKIIDQHRILHGVYAVWNNPTINYNGNPIPTSMRSNKRLVVADEPAALTLDDSNVPKAETMQKIVTDLKQVGGEVQSVTGSNPAYSTAPTIYAGNAITAAHLNTINSIINNINNILNSYNSWFDANDLCQRSCQVNCQIGCQVACQWCVTFQCHDQNCGTS